MDKHCLSEENCDNFVVNMGQVVYNKARAYGLSETECGSIAVEIMDEINHLYQGERVTIRKVQQRLHLKKRIAAEFDGTNLAEIIERYGVSRSTVYRYAAARNA
jgi:Mor family transcriptional regulator